MNKDAVVRFLDSIKPAFHAEDPDVFAKQREDEHVRVIEASYKAIAAGDLPALLGLLDDDVELEIVSPAAIPFQTHARGRDQFLAVLAHNFALVADQQPEILGLVAQGDVVMVLGREQGAYRPTGKAYEMYWTQCFTVRNGRIRSVREVGDFSNLLEAVKPADNPTG